MALHLHTIVLAQRIEQSPYKRWVAGLNPAHDSWSEMTALKANGSR